MIKHKSIFLNIVKKIGIGLYKIFLFIDRHTLVQLIIIFFIIRLLGVEIFKHSKVGFFINCQETVIHDNKDMRNSTIDKYDLISSKLLKNLPNQPTQQ